MGRANNSFTDWVGHATEIDGEKVTLPEKDLWVAVLTRARQTFPIKIFTVIIVEQHVISF